MYLIQKKFSKIYKIKFFQELKSQKRTADFDEI